MAHIVIDFMGDDTVIAVPNEEDPKEVARKEAMRRKALEDIFRRAPQPALQIVPVAPEKKR